MIVVNTTQFVDFKASKILSAVCILFFLFYFILGLIKFKLSRGRRAQRETICFIIILSSDCGSRLAVCQVFFMSEFILQKYMTSRLQNKSAKQIS